MKITFKRTNFGAAVLAAFCCMGLQLLILVCRDGGSLHFESVFFFMNYLEERPLLSKIMDPYRNDWGFYQARELSYLFDYLDSRFAAFLLKKQVVWFHSVCSLLLCGGMVFIQHYWSRKFFPKVPGLLITMISVFFVLSGAVTGLEYFRCAKYLTAFGLWGALFSGYAVYRRGSKPGKVCLVLSLLLMTLSDRQGFFFTAAFSGITALLMLKQNFFNAPVTADRLRFPALSGAAVTLFGVVNNLFLTPAIIRAVNGYSPDFSYQRDFHLTVKGAADGFLMVLGNVGNWFSNFTGDIRIAAVTGVLLAAGMGVALWYGTWKGERRMSSLALLWGSAFLSMLVCAAAMVSRHPMVMLPDVVYGTYAINFLVIVLFLLTLTAASGKKRLCRILLIFIFAGIFLRLGGEALNDRFAPPDYTFTGYNAGQKVLKEALRDPSFDEKKHCIPYRMELFLEFYRKHILTKQ